MTKPHGNCSDMCVGGQLNTDEEIESHNHLVDALVKFQETGDVYHLADALELLAWRTKDPSKNQGVPIAGDFPLFVAQHNWPDPGRLYMLGKAVGELWDAVAFRTREADRIIRGAVAADVA